MSFVPYLCLMVCVCVGWVGAIFMRQQGTPSQMARFIDPIPNPISISA